MDFKLYDNELVPHQLIGLQNASNYCWLNSLVQVLISLPAFTHALNKIPSEKQTTFTKSLLNVIQTLNNSNENIVDVSSKLNMDIVSSTKLWKNNMVGYGQSCADEALTTILQLIDDKYVEYVMTNVYGYNINCTNCKQIISDVRDRATKITITSQSNMTTEEFCKHIMRRTSICSEYKCENCNMILYDVPRTEFVRTVREIIIVMFNKFYTKDYFYDYPSKLSFPKKGGGSIDYILVGIVEHYGTMAGGHYTSRAYRHGKWYNFNDSHISSSDPNPTKDTFMLAYHVTA
jgi:ubiquitin C-terminal hydrolase